MSDMEKPKSAREIWTDMINESYILTSDEERQMMAALDDDLIELALNSRNALKFMQELPNLDPDFSLRMPHKDIPEKYRLIMQLINKRKKEQKIKKQR